MLLLDLIKFILLNTFDTIPNPLCCPSRYLRQHWTADDVVTDYRVTQRLSNQQSNADEGVNKIPKAP